jgi:hypothetical protein
VRENVFSKTNSSAWGPLLKEHVECRYVLGTNTLNQRCCLIQRQLSNFIKPYQNENRQYTDGRFTLLNLGNRQRERHPGRAAGTAVRVLGLPGAMAEERQ